MLVSTGDHSSNIHCGTMNGSTIVLNRVMYLSHEIQFEMLKITEWANPERCITK